MIKQVYSVDVVRSPDPIGGSQPKVMRCSDGRKYVVKFPNNPQGKQVLFNDAYGTLLARALGLPAPEIAAIQVAKELIDSRPNRLAFDLGRNRIPCEAGLCFGSEVIGSFGPRAMRRHVVTSGLQRAEMVVPNLSDFGGMLIFDKWTSNLDVRQVLFVGWSSQKTFRVVMIDQGHCFGGVNRRFMDLPITGVFWDRRVYAGIRGIDSFEVWLDVLENGITESLLHQLAASIPAEWYDGNAEFLEKLVETIYARRMKVRGLIEAVIKEGKYFGHRNFPAPYVSFHNPAPKNVARLAEEEGIAVK
jgi:hypothetical protein